MRHPADDVHPGHDATWPCLLNLSFCFSTFAEQPQTSLNDLASVAYLRTHSPSELVRSAIEEEAAFRAKTKDDFDWYLIGISRLFSSSNRSADEVYRSVLTRMRNDLAIAQRLKVEFASLSPEKGEITYSCKANRLVEFLTKAIELYEKHGHIILQGRVPPELKGYWKKVRCLGDCEGHSQEHNALDLAFKASLVLTKLELEGRNTLSRRDVAPGAAFVHATPLPKGRTIEGIDSLSLFYNGTLSHVEGELGFVHGGYAFGGQSQDITSRHSPYGRPLGPQDCSSWISKILELPQIMSTIDFVAFSRDSCADSKNLQSVSVDSISDLQPGMILITRKFNLEKDPTMTATLGESGHAQLIIDVDAETETFLTLEYARNLPEYEGFGVRKVRFAFENDVKPFFFVKTPEA